MTWDPTKVPLTIRISTFSKYLANHFDYTDDDAQAPSADEVAASKRTPEPIGLEFIDEFVYDHSSARIIDRKGHRFKPKEALDFIFRKHCETVHRWKGLSLRLQLSMRGHGVGLLTALADLQIWILKTCFGRTLSEKDTLGIYYRGYKLEDFKKLSEDKIKLFGYRTGRSTVIVFCALILVVGIGFYPDGPTGRLAFIAESNTMLAAGLILSLAALDFLGPLTVLMLLNATIKIRALMIFGRKNPER